MTKNGPKVIKNGPKNVFFWVPFWTPFSQDPSQITPNPPYSPVWAIGGGHPPKRAKMAVFSKGYPHAKRSIGDYS